MTVGRPGSRIPIRGAVAHAIVRKAMDDPSALALRDDRTTFSRSELVARSARLAARLDDGTSDPILLVRFEGPVLAVSLVAANIVGRPVVVAGWAQDAEAWTAIAHATGATVLLGSGHDQHPTLPNIDATPFIADSADTPFQELLDVGESEQTEPDESGPFVIVTTSGSTGPPKLCTVLDAGLLVDAAESGSRPEGPQPADRFALPTAGSGAVVLALGRALVDGICTTLLDALRLAPSVFLEILREHRITVLRMPASLLRRVVRSARSTGPLPELRSVSVYGEALLWSDIASVREHLSQGAAVATSYGTTEAGRVTVRVVGPDEELRDGAVDVGKPIASRRVWIDAGDGEEAGPGVPGSIVIDGTLHRSGAGIEPLPDGSARARPGDTGFLDGEGRLVLVGRTDRMIKIAATRVEPQRVEAALLDIAGVLEAATAPFEFAPNEHRLVAFVATTTGTGLTGSGLLQALRSKVPSAALPARILVRFEPLPLLPSGKIDVRRLLAELSPD
jgi:acyl-coenzyme A synthetase/AMP-(fatty) acid ligase